MSEYTADADGMGVLRLLNAIRSAGLEKKTKFYQAHALRALCLCWARASRGQDWCLGEGCVLHLQWMRHGQPFLGTGVTAFNSVCTQRRASAFVWGQPSSKRTREVRARASESEASARARRAHACVSADVRTTCVCHCAAQRKASALVICSNAAEAGPRPQLAHHREQLLHHHGQQQQRS
eukprot:6198846-Pleurochrysis_carterae.AAC.2